MTTYHAPTLEELQGDWQTIDDLPREVGIWRPICDRIVTPLEGRGVRIENDCVERHHKDVVHDRGRLVLHPGDRDAGSAAIDWIQLANAIGGFRRLGSVRLAGNRLEVTMPVGLSSGPRSDEFRPRRRGEVRVEIFRRGRLRHASTGGCPCVKVEDAARRIDARWLDGIASFSRVPTRGALSPPDSTLQRGLDDAISRLFPGPSFTIDGAAAAERLGVAGDPPERVRVFPPAQGRTSWILATCGLSRVAEETPGSLPGFPLPPRRVEWFMEIHGSWSGLTQGSDPRAFEVNGAEDEQLWPLRVLLEGAASARAARRAPGLWSVLSNGRPANVTRGPTHHPWSAASWECGWMLCPSDPLGAPTVVASSDATAEWFKLVPLQTQEVDLAWREGRGALASGLGLEHPQRSWGTPGSPGPLARQSSPGATGERRRGFSISGWRARKAAAQSAALLRKMDAESEARLDRFAAMLGSEGTSLEEYRAVLSIGRLSEEGRHEEALATAERLRSASARAWLTQELNEKQRGSLGTLYKVIAAGEPALLDLLRDLGLDLMAELGRKHSGETPLDVAVAAGNLASLAWLLEAGADPNFGDAAIRALAHEPRVRQEVLQLLLDHGLDGERIYTRERDGNLDEGFTVADRAAQLNHETFRGVSGLGFRTRDRLIAEGRPPVREADHSGVARHFERELGVRAACVWVIPNSGHVCVFRAECEGEAGGGVLRFTSAIPGTPQPVAAFLRIDASADLSEHGVQGGDFYWAKTWVSIAASRLSEGFWPVGTSAALLHSDVGARPLAKGLVPYVSFLVSEMGRADPAGEAVVLLRMVPLLREEHRYAETHSAEALLPLIDASEEAIRGPRARGSVVG